MGAPALRLAAGAALILAAAMMSEPLSSQAQRGGRRLSTTWIDGREAVDGEVIVRYRNPTGTIERERAEFQADADEVEPLGARGAERVRSRRLNTQELLQTLQANPDLEFVEPNYIVRIGAAPNDPSFGSLWGLLNTGQTLGTSTGIPGVDIDAVDAWAITTGSRAVVVGVVDTGIDYTHPDLAANIWTAPRDFTVAIGGLTITCAAGTHGFNAISNTCNPADDHFHGTHVAGTIGAVGNNGVGVVGVNWTASIMGLKFLNAQGAGTLTDAIKAIEFAVQAKSALGPDANIRILSNSWAGGAFSQALRNQIQAANAQDMLFVAAAGNNGTNNDSFPTYPASYTVDNVISVAATTNRDQRASFSNWGATSVHLGAPGHNILSTVPNNKYEFFSGTSMATPHVSGVAALVLSACARTTAQLKTILLTSTDPVAALGGITTTGGRVNAHAAVAMCDGELPSLAIATDEDTISVTVSNGPANPTDWLAVYCPASNPDTSYMTRRYLNGSTTPPENGLETATVTFAKPRLGGTCNARLFMNDGWTKLAVSDVVSFPIVPSTVTVTNPSVAAGATLNVVVANAPGSRFDWVGTYRIGAPDFPAVTWAYLNGLHAAPVNAIWDGTVPLPAPAEPGSYEVRLLADNGYTKVATSNVVTVTPPPTLTINDVSVTEGNAGSATAAFTVTLSPANTAQTVSVAYATANGTATAGADYGASSGTLTFAPGVTSRTITVPIVGDTSFEADETFVVTLTNAAHALIGDAQGAATIVNDDVFQPASITLLTPIVAPGGVIRFVVANGPENPTDWLGLFPATAADTQYIGWMFLNGTTVVPATGLSTATLQFTAPTTLGTYNVRFFANYGYTRLATSANITVGAGPALSVGDVTIAEGNSGTSVATFTVTLSPVNTAQTVTVNYATADGSATANSDYTTANGTLTFEPSVGSRTVAVTVNGDTTGEPSETFVLSLSNATNALIADGSGTATIVNDDAASGATVTLPASVRAGAMFEAVVANGPASRFDWIAVYAVGAADWPPLSWSYLNGQGAPPATGLSNATVPMQAPATPGTYEVRLYADNGYTRLATSALTVRPPSITVLTPTVAPGGVIRFSVADGPANPGDWVGLYVSTAGDGAYVNWMYLNGTTSPPATGISNATLEFAAPSTPGTYNVRLFGTQKLATSAAITVASP